MNSLFRHISGLDESHHRPTQLFLQSLAGVYAIAFTSLALQIRGLIGQEGILPAENFLEHISALLGPTAWKNFPSLFWFSLNDQILVGTCWMGVALSLLIALGRFQGPLLLINWALYLSLVSVGQVFLSYQWDVLLLETGFLAIWMTPWKFGRHNEGRPEPSLILVWLLRWLLFRLMFASGWVKLSSDEVWRDLTALNFHYWTQPLPTWTAWWIHQAPEIVSKACVVVTLFIECWVPWMIFLGRRCRIVAALTLGGFQLALLLTGNFGFFNILALSLCIPLWSDRRTDMPSIEFNEAPSADHPSGTRTSLFSVLRNFQRFARWALCLLILILSLAALVRMEIRDLRLPYPIDAVERFLGPFRIVNRYGLFADMTEQRPEIILEVSSDGDHWESVRFKWKPGPLDQRPRFTMFHMPRLDWQMWFEGLNFLAQDRYYEERQVDSRSRTYYPNRWFFNFIERVAEGQNPATELLAPMESPLVANHVRARIFFYEFSTITERKNQENWWNRSNATTYVPSINAGSP